MATITWTGQSGDWTDTANWDSGTVPGAGDDVLLSGSGYYAVSASSAIHVASITFQNFYAYLDLSGNGVKDVVGQDLTNSGNLVIDGDDQSGGTTLWVGGTLTNNNTLTVGSNYGTLTGPAIVRTDHLDNLNTIFLDGGADKTTRAVLDVRGDAAPDSLTGTYYLSGDANLKFASGEITSIGWEAGLTLDGAHARVSDAAHPATNSALADLTTNNGDLTLADGSSLYDVQSDFQNFGFLNISGGSKFRTADGVNLLNTDVLEVGQGGSLKISGTLTNTDTIFIDGDGVTPSIVDVGHLSNSYAINLSAENGTSPQQAAVLRDLGDAAPSTLDGDVTLSVMGNSLIEFASGSITSIGQYATLKIDGSQARIADAGAVGSNSALSDLASNAGTLILSDGAVLKNGAVPFDNSGTYRILDHTSVSTAPGVGFINSGELDVDTDGSVTPYSGSSLNIGGALTNTGALAIQSGYSFGAPDPTIVTVHGLAAIGDIFIAGNTAFSQNVLAELNDIGGVAPATLIAGEAIVLSGDALLQFASGGITSIAQGALLSLDGLDARVADSNLPTINSALTGLSTNAGALTLSDGADLLNEAVAFSNSGIFRILNNTAVITNPGVDFNNTGSLDIDTAYGDSGSTLAIGGTLTNTGSIEIGNSNDNGGGITEVTANQFVNTGTISLTTAPGSSSLVWLNDTGAAPSTLSAGEHFSLAGNALLEFGTGKIETIAANASIMLSGSKAFIADASNPNANSALSQLSSNAGQFSLSDGASFKAQGSFTNSGTLSLARQASFHAVQDFSNTGTFNVDASNDLNGAGGSVMTVDGTLTNSKDMYVGYSFLPMSGDVTVDTAHLVNTGFISLSGNTYQATLDVTDDSAPSTLLSGSISLTGDALLEYASGSITSIAKGAFLEISGAQARVADASDATTDSALSGLAGNAGTFEISGGASVANGASDFSNSGNLFIENFLSSVGSTFDVGGALTNTGTINVSDVYGGTLNAASLTNSGTITIQNSTSALNLTGDATNTGTINIGNFNNGALSAGGDYTQSAGLTNLDDGTLSAGDVIVSGGTLNGDGQIVGDVNVTGGTFASGFFKNLAIGTMGVTGDFNLQSGGTIGAVFFANALQADEIRITGGLNLSGGTLDIKVLDPANLHAGETFTIMTFTPGDLTGQFSEIEDGNFVGDGTSVNIFRGLALDVLYNNSAGTVQVEVVNASASAANAHQAPIDDAVLALDSHGLFMHHGDVALHFAHALEYDNVPLI